ncbi:hypothetical protein NC652_017557 [Populus alba x Populus x berolinensis]|nr:hypothetical protein NC652_017557 [Populus alba x Populus x berolinensis]
MACGTANCLVGQGLPFRRKIISNSEQRILCSRHIHQRLEYPYPLGAARTRHELHRCMALHVRVIAPLARVRV